MNIHNSLNISSRSYEAPNESSFVCSFLLNHETGTQAFPSSGSVIFSTWIQYYCALVLVAKNLPASACDIRDSSSVSESGRCPRRGRGSHSNILAWRIQWTEEAGGLRIPWGAEWTRLKRLSTAQHICKKLLEM